MIFENMISLCNQTLHMCVCMCHLIIVFLMVSLSHTHICASIVFLHIDLSVFSKYVLQKDYKIISLCVTVTSNFNLLSALMMFRNT